MMINTGFSVPGNYYSRSRDFQLIGRIMDCVFNSSKMYSDMVAYDTICKNTDTRLLDLVSKTIGFDVKRVYDTEDLYVLCSTFNSILKRKGTIESVKDCIRVLLKSQNIDKSFTVDDVYALKEFPGGVTRNVKQYRLNIYIPHEMTDIALLEDMLDYVLPTGYVYTIITTAQTDSSFRSVDGGVSVDVSHNNYVVGELGRVFDDADSSSNVDKYKTELSVIYRPEDSSEGE